MSEFKYQPINYDSTVVTPVRAHPKFTDFTITLAPQYSSPYIHALDEYGDIWLYAYVDNEDRTAKLWKWVRLD